MNELKRMNYLMSETNEAYHGAAVKLGLSDSAMTILYAICNSGGSCLLSEITRMSGTSKQTINSALRKLEREGIIYLEAAGNRKKLVCLTKEGKALAECTAMRVMAVENAILDSWTQEERRVYLDLQQRYLDQFKEKTKELAR